MRLYYLYLRKGTLMDGTRMNADLIRDYPSNPCYLCSILWNADDAD